MTENEISYEIRGAIFRIHNELGPGLLESVYETVLEYELKKTGLKVKTQVPQALIYQNVRLDQGFRLDILVEDKVIIEIKSVEMLLKVHHKQLMTYLKLANKKLGILVNFNCDSISDNIFRKLNGYLN